ncbi:hypothetical protein GJ496_000732, partial [Pomphorhynchus laevis]
MEVLDLGLNFAPATREFKRQELFDVFRSTAKHAFENVQPQGLNKQAVKHFLEHPAIQKYTSMTPNQCYRDNLRRDQRLTLRQLKSIRLKKLSSRNDIFEKALNDLYAHLRRRGYFHRQIETQFARARRRNRNDLLMPSKTKDTTTNMTCIPYHAALRRLQKDVSIAYKSVDFGFGNIGREPRLFYSVNDKISKHLVSSRITRQTNEMTNNDECSSRSCDDAR